VHFHVPNRGVHRPGQAPAALSRSSNAKRNRTRHDPNTILRRLAMLQFVRLILVALLVVLATASPLFAGDKSGPNAGIGSGIGMGLAIIGIGIGIGLVGYSALNGIA